MKRLKLLFLAFLPFAAGYLLNYAMLKFNWYGTTIHIISLLFFAYWFFAGYISVDYTSSVWESILIGNSFGTVSIILIVFQEVVLGRYLLNIIGIAPQMFYLPALVIVFSIERILLFFISTHYLWATCILAYLLMIAVYYAGYRASLRKKHRL